MNESRFDRWWQRQPEGLRSSLGCLAAAILLVLFVYVVIEVCLE